LRFNRAGGLLASGGRDTDCIVWDVVAEAGLFRLKGHRDEVTGVVFCEQGTQQRLVTCSKDSHVRVWDLTTQHCIQTVVGHRCEVWSLDVDPAERRLVTGAADAQLRVFRIAHEKSPQPDGVPPESDEDFLIPCSAPLARPSPDRSVTVRFSPHGSVLAVISAGRLLELWNLHSEDEARRRAKRRMKRKRDKAVGGGPPAPEGGQPEVMASDEMTLRCTVPLKHRALAFSWCPKPPVGVAASFAISLASNTVEVYDLAASAPDGTAADTPPEPQRVADVSLPGHRADVRAVALSADDSLLISTSHSGAKVRVV
jgi:U3 small nucleolar RNA-associated protein 12